MGSGLSVSSIVEKLYALKSEDRSTALDNLCEQHPEIKNYLKTKYLEDPLPLSGPKTRPPRSKVLSINGPAPDAQKLSAEYASWSKDTASFWKSASFTFVPEETHSRPLRFIYNATIQQQRENQESCLRCRYLALFWFDYFTARYPGRGYDHEYMDLNREIAGDETNADDSIVSTLRDQVRAGRKYNKLTERFGDGMLLILPSYVARSTLEQRLPLTDAAFKEFVSPLVGDWEKCAKTESIANLGASIRQSLLGRCRIQRVQAPSISSRKSTKREADRSRQPPTRKPKKQQKHPPNATASISTNPPTTPRIWEHVYHLEGDATITDQAETAQATHANSVAVHPQDISFDHDPGSPTQLGNECTLHLCNEGSLPFAAITGAVGHAINEPERQHQDIEGPRSAQHATNQRATEESGDTAVPDGTVPRTGESSGVEGEGKILCYGSRTKLIGICQSRRSYAFRPHRRRLGDMRRLSVHTKWLPSRRLYTSPIRF